uniref:Uncharacterized protein n=1 Tax=Caenorhabditis japonica TaxID=281687 RepID=A0A8R1J1Y9_CAEJA
MRVANGQVAAASILAMQTFDFDRQKYSIDNLKEGASCRILFAYGSKDFLIDEKDSEEVANYIGRNHHIIDSKKNEDSAIFELRRSFKEGHLTGTANFANEGHYLQKTHPKFIVEAIDSMFENK